MATPTDDAPLVVQIGLARVMIPTAVVVAIITFGANYIARPVASPEASELRREVKALRDDVAALRGEMAAWQRDSMTQWNRIETDAKNRDVVQDAAIATIRNR